GCTVMRRSLAEMVLIVKIASFNFLGRVAHAGGKLGSFCKINISPSNPWSAKRFIPTPKYAICGRLSRGGRNRRAIAREAHTRPERHGRPECVWRGHRPFRTSARQRNRPSPPSGAFLKVRLAHGLTNAHRHEPSRFIG